MSKHYQVPIYMVVKASNKSEAADRVRDFVDMLLGLDEFMYLWGVKSPFVELEADTRHKEIEIIQDAN